MAHAQASVDEIAGFLDGLLEVEKYRNAEPGSNGLLFRAGDGIAKFAVAVNTSLTTIMGAAKSGAGLLVVHHTTWAEIDLHLYDEKMQALAGAGISLYGAHAALDCVPRINNAWILAEALGVEVDQPFGDYLGGQPGIVGVTTCTFGEFVLRASRELRVDVEAHEHAKTFGRVAIVPGAAGHTSFLDAARRAGADTYVTGEGSMYTRMFARECGMNLIFGTHHATETPGIKALGERIADVARVPWEFIADSPDVF